MIILPIQAWLQRTLKLLPVGLLVMLPCSALDIVCWPAHSWAADEALSDPTSQTSDPAPALTPAPANIVLLPPITVVAAPKPMTGQGNTIHSEILEQLPLRNNSINEALTILPGIQYSETANLSTQGGEILPPGVSISGGKIFENNFTIDGISNNSLLDPAGTVKLDSPTDIPGHPQELFLDSTLVEQITVYDNNVPARFGGFKGGVIEATTLNPAPILNGKLFYRTTRDTWTSFHIADEKEEDFNNSSDHREQPKFRKHHGGFDLHLPLSPRLLTVGAYRQLYSRIPLKQNHETKTQERHEENFLFKTVFQPTERTSFDFLWNYTPYRGTYFKDGFRDSDFTLYGGGHLFSATCHTRFSVATLDLQAAYRRSENSRKAPSHMTQIETSPGVWDQEGFLGDIEKSQQSFQLKTDLAFLPFALGAANHAVNTGFDIQHIEGTYERQDTSYLYTYPIDDSPTAFDDYPNRKAYEASDAEAVLKLYSFYLEDITTWGSLEIRPGMRLDYDDYMQNFNLAPRLATALDIFGNHRTHLIAGYNRYYSNTLFAYKLREGIKPPYQELLIAGEWTPYKGHTTDTRYSELDTPYADEYVLGLEHQLFGGKADVKYIHRKGRDEFAKTFEKEEDGIFYNTLNNNGRSRHESYQISWERQWRNQYLSINGTYQKTNSSSESYDNLLDEGDLAEQVWHNGHLLYKSDLPRKDFNRSWVINLTYMGKLPYGFTLSGLAKYRSGYKAVLSTFKRNPDVVLPDGTNPYIYDSVKKGGSVILSCRVAWEKRLYSKHSMVLSLEINNLLNKKSPVADSNDYEIGRQVWAGVEYHF